MTNYVNVNPGVTLTLDPGVVIKFDTTNSRPFIVQGTLIAQGDSGNKIYFTSNRDDTVGGDTNGDGGSSLPQPGDWYGVWLQGDTGNQGSATLTHCVFRYGGNLAVSFTSFYTMLWIYGSNGTVNISNSTFEKSLHTGLCPEYSKAPGITGCSFSNNAEWGIVYVGTAVNLTSNTFGGNGSGAVLCRATGSGQSIGDLTLSGNTISTTNGGRNGIALEGYVLGNSRWQGNSGFPYIVTTYVNVNPGVTLTLDPGVVIKFDTTNSRPFIVQGTLIAQGDSGNKIYFTSNRDDTVGGDTNGDGGSSLPQPGDWYGVWLQGDTGNQGSATLTHCVFRYGGNLAVSFTSFYTMLWIYSGNGTVNISNSTFEKSLHTACVHSIEDTRHHRMFFFKQCRVGYCLYGSPVNLTNNTFGGNGSGAVLYSGTGTGGWLGDITLSGNSISGNNGGQNGIAVEGPVTGNSRWWAQSGFPYIITNNVYVNPTVTLTLDPGVVIKFALTTSTPLVIQGTLDAQGTDTNKIYFTSIKDDEVGGDTNGDGGSIFLSLGIGRGYG